MITRMKILYAINSINPDAGGVAEGTYNSSKEMIKRGHALEIASLDDPNAPFVENFELPCHALGPGRGFYNYSSSYKSWMAENIRRFDCVIIQGIWRYHALTTRHACMKNNVPYFVFTHGMLSPWFKHSYPLKHMKKWLFWPWGDYRVLRDARAVLFTTEEERLLSRQSFWLYRARERTVGYGINDVPDGVDGQKKAFFKNFPALAAKPFLFFIGRIHPVKGCDLLINAFAELSKKYPEWHLVMAGPDQVGLRGELEALCAKNGVADKVHWIGMISGDVKWGAFRAAEAFVLPSHQENFGIVVAEAMACGTSVLITDKVNIWREVESSGGGLVQPDTLKDVAALLEQFLALSPQARQDMSDAARLGFEKHFTIQEATASLEGALLKGIEEQTT